MENKVNYLMILFVAAAVALCSPSAFAKKEGDPAGWHRGAKKGWDGKGNPPGLSKAEAKKHKHKAEKEARKHHKKAKAKEKEAKEAAEKTADAAADTVASATTDSTQQATS